MNQSLETFIQRHPFFKGMKSHHLAMMYKGAREASYNPGETLFSVGEPANRFFLVRSGSVGIEAHDPGGGVASIESVREGEVIGWSWLFPPFTWHLRARALEPTSVIVLDGAHLLATAEQYHDFGYELMKRVAQILVHRQNATQKQLLQLQSEAVMEGRF